MKRLGMVGVLIFAILAMPATGASAASKTALADAAMIDAWVFYDNDLNGVYSTGDYGLSDVTVCVYSVVGNGVYGKKLSCVGTDQGDTWWEDLKRGLYLVRVVPSTVPEGASLSSILCQRTSGESFAGCKYDLGLWTAAAVLGPETRLNIFFALAPMEQ